MIASATGDGRDACRGELLGQSRRRALTDAGRLALDAHLAACASCRLARDVLADFDQVDVVDIRDGARIRALVDVARAAKGGGAAARAHARSRSRLRATAAAAAVIVFGGSASAAVWLWRRPAPEGTGRPVAAARVDAPARPASRAAWARPAPADAPVEARQPTVPPARHRPPARTTTAAAVTHVSAAALLAEAGRARADGQVDRAAVLYRRLQREFPGTPEAQVSTVPLGRLLLDGGAARAALAAFEAYLRDAPRGPLIAEALYGKGRALEALGERDDERRTWERLMRDDAGGAYVVHARRRLAALK